MLPKYDKSQMNGRGDRSNEAVLLDATDIDVFLLEGWMLGKSYAATAASAVTTSTDAPQ